MTSAGGNKVKQFGDNCHSIPWGCVQQWTPTSPFTVDKKNKIWQRSVEVVGPNTGKLDLAGMYAAGRMTVAGNMTWTSPGHPRAGAPAAFDGSTEYWSSAISNGTAGTMNLDLGGTYTLNRIGISLRRGLPASATVAVSRDNVTWTTVATRTNEVSYALRYADIAPVAARYVRVQAAAGDDCDAGLQASCAFLNEIELFSTVNGFENDPWGNLPRGFDTTRPNNQVWVTDDTSGGSHRALRLKDESASHHAQVSFAGAAATTRTLQFRIKPLSFAGGGFLLDINSGATAVHHLGVWSDGTVHYHTGAGWSAALNVATVPLNQWSTITVTASGNNATVSINNGAAVSVPPLRSAASVSGYTFASAGTGATGDQVLIDDVLFT